MDGHVYKGYGTKSIEVEGILLSGHIVIKRIMSFSSLAISKFVCNGFNVSYPLKFRNVLFDKNGFVLIVSSDLSKMEFSNVNFNDTPYAIVDSSVTECVFNNVTWPKKMIPANKIDPHLSFLNSEKHKLMRETYRQLKYANERQGNRINALFFYRLEMSAYWNYIWKERGFSIKNAFEDFIIVGPNWLFSNFGQSFWRPFWSMIVMHFILFLFLIEGNNLGVSVDWENGTWSGFQESWKLFWATILPVHKFELKGEDISGFIDISMRVCSSLFIYYIISASRQYASK